MNEEVKVPRRDFVIGASLMGGLMAPGEAFAQTKAAPQPREAAAGNFRVAVMHVPVLVPPSIDALPDTRAKNMAAWVEAIESTMRGPEPKPRIIVFPVLMLTSSSRAQSGIPIADVAVDLTSKPLDQTVYAPIVAACRRHNCYVATSTQEIAAKMPGRHFHTGLIIGPEGLVLRSPKSQAPSAPEMSYLRDIAKEYVAAYGPDSIMPVAKTPVGTLACYVEGEAEVLEVSRLMASKGAQIILHTSLENDEVPWLALKQAIGYQCQVFLLTGTTSRLRYKDHDDWRGGSATIVGPDGKVLASMGGHDEGFAAAEINLAAIDEAKKKSASRVTPAWDLYTKLYGG